MCRTALTRWAFVPPLLCAGSLAAQPLPEAPPEEPAPAEAQQQPPKMVEQEAVVYGTALPKTAGSAHLLRDKQLKRMGYDDPHAVLAGVPGVYSRGEDGVGLRPNIGLRGVNPDRSKKVTLLEDGIPFSPAPYSAPAAYYFPLVQRMSQVRVLKGPAALVYGPQTVGGAIDFVTRKIPVEPTAGVDLAGGQYGYAKGHVFAGTSTDRLGVLVEGLHLRSSGFKELPDGADTGFARNEWMVKGSWLLDPAATIRQEFRLKLTYSDEVSNETYLGLTDADLRETPDRRYAASALDQMKNHRTSLVFSHVAQLRPDMELTTSFDRSAFSRVWSKVNGFRGANLFDVLKKPDSPQNQVFVDVLRGADATSAAETLLIGPNVREFLVQGLQSRLHWDPDTGPVSHKIEAGLRLHQDEITRRHSQDAFVQRGGKLVPEGSPTEVTAHNRASTSALALHVMDAATISRLTLTGGVRLEAMRSAYEELDEGTRTERTAAVLLPSLGAYFGLTDSFGLLAGAYRGFSPPAPGSGEEVQPETSINYEAGARFTSGALRAEVVGFFNDYSNLTDVCTLSSGCIDEHLDRQFDAGAAHIAGVEAYARHELRAGPVKLPLALAYTFTQATFATSFQSDDPMYGKVEAGDELPYVPRHQLHVEAGVEHARASLNASATYVSRMREQAGSGPLEEALATDEQLTVDATATYKLPAGFVLYGNVRNLLDARFSVSRRPFGARPNAPRWVQVGVRTNF